MNSRSLRFRLVVWYGVWLTVFCLAFGGVMHLVSKEYLERTLKEALSRRARQAADLVQRGALWDRDRLASEIQTRFAPEANNRFFRIVRLPEQEIYRSGAPADGSFDAGLVPPSPILQRAGATREIMNGDQVMFLVSARVHAANGEYVVEVGSSAAVIEATLHHVLMAFATALPVLIAVAVAGGWVLVRRALQPVDQIIRAAERISSRNLDERLPVRATGDELERLSTALNNMIRRLDQAFQHNARFMADTSHELRTPLMIMQAELEDAMQAHPPGSEVCQLAGGMLEEVQRLARIVDGLFAMSRLEAGGAQPEFVRVDLGRVVTNTAEQMSLLAEDKNVAIACTAAVPVFVLADESGLKQITVNLLDNAIKYTAPGGSIAVRVHAQDSKAMLEVADTGRGIPAAALPHVFERFFRVDKARSRELGGAGLGLAIVKAICSAHGGTVDVESEEGRGSRFIVALPLAA